jgi:hypothetical protein
MRGKEDERAWQVRAGVMRGVRGLTCERRGQEKVVRKSESEAVPEREVWEERGKSVKSESREGMCGKFEVGS